METAVTPQNTVVKVPLDQILVVPEDNPRGLFPQQDVDDMAASLKAGGQQEPILLRPRADEERAKAYPDKPTKLVGGYLRVAAAPLAGLTALDAIIRPMTPRQERQAAILNNVRKDMNWLAWGESAKALMADDPDLTIPGAASLLAKDDSWLRKLLKLLKLLNFPARRAIQENFLISGGYVFYEAYAHALEALATGGPGDQDLIERAVKTAIERRMDLAKVKKMVEWVKRGNKPEDFPADGSLKTKKGSKQGNFDPADPLAPLWQDLPRTVQVHKTPKGYKAALTLSKDDAALALYGALAAVEEVKKARGADFNPRYRQGMDGMIAQAQGAGSPMESASPSKNGQDHGFAGTQGKFPVKASTDKGELEGDTAGTKYLGGVGRAASWLFQPFRGLLGPLSRLLNPVFSTMAHSLGRYLAQGLVWILLVVLGLAGLHYAHSKFRGWRLVAPATASIPQNQPTVAGAPTLNPAPYANSPSELAQPKQGPQHAASARAPQSSPKWVDPESKVPDELRQREKDDKQRALKLWGLFWAIAYNHYFDYWRDEIGDQHLSQECNDDFDTAYFNDDLQDGIKKEKLYYKTGQPEEPKLVDSSETTMTIEVDGPVTQLGDAVYKGKVFWHNRMALVVAFEHDPNGNWTVTKIEKKPAGGKKAPAKTPAKAGVAAKGKDVLQQVGEGVKDVQGAVSTANDVKSTSDKARALFGL